MNIKNLKILFNEITIQKRIEEMASEMNKFYHGEEICVICVLKGAVMFTVDLIKHLNMPLKIEFIRLASYNGGTSTTGKVNAVDISLPNLNNKNVLIVEDIVDTGLTAKFLLDFIQCNFQTKSTKFCSLLDKKVARLNDIEPDYYGFEVDDQFLIGYGLDYDGLYRNIKYIGYVDKTDLE